MLYWPQLRPVRADEGLASIGIGPQKRQVGVRRTPAAIDGVAWHHMRHHRETRLIGGVGTGAMEGQTVMEAGLTGLQDTGLIKPFTPPRYGKARRLLLQVLRMKPCALRDQAPFVRADNGPHTAIAEIGILQSDPGRTHIGRARGLPVAVILVPADVALRRHFMGACAGFIDVLVVPEAHCSRAHQPGSNGTKDLARDGGANAIIEPEGITLLAHLGRSLRDLYRAVLRRNLMVVVACPEPLMGREKAGNLLVIKEPRTDPVASLPVLLDHCIRDNRIDIDRQ